jgi:hypothetical protein
MQLKQSKTVSCVTWNVQICVDLSNNSTLVHLFSLSMWNVEERLYNGIRKCMRLSGCDNSFTAPLSYGTVDLNVVVAQFVTQVCDSLRKARQINLTHISTIISRRLHSQSWVPDYSRCVLTRPLISTGVKDVKVRIWEVWRPTLSPGDIPQYYSDVHTSEYLPITKTKDVPPSYSTHTWEDTEAVQPAVWKLLQPKETKCTCTHTHTKFPYIFQHMLQELRFSQRCCWRFQSSGMLLCVGC